MWTSARASRTGASLVLLVDVVSRGASCNLRFYDGTLTDSMFMIPDCWKLFDGCWKLLERINCPGAPPVSFENCETTVRAIWQTALPAMVQEFSDPGPKVLCLKSICCTLGRFISTQEFHIKREWH